MGTADAEIGRRSAETHPELSVVSSATRVVGHNIALRASSAVMDSTFLFAAILG